MGNGSTAETKQSYDTPLTAEEQSLFQQWVKEQSALQNRDVSKDANDYDIQGFWKGKNQVDERGHGSDQFKKPNHPTFSDESQYSSPSTPGGQWINIDGNFYFAPSAYMLDKNFGGDTMKAARFYNKRYFPRADKDVQLILKGTPVQ